MQVWMFSVVGIVGFIITIFLGAWCWSKDSDSWIVLGTIVFMLTIGFFCISFIPSAVIYSQRAYGRTQCRNWGEQTGYKTKFEILNWMDGGTCLAQSTDGRWVLNSKIIVNNPTR